MKLKKLIRRISNLPVDEFMSTIPDDFALFDTSSPFIRHVGPLYYRADEDKVDLGLLVEEVHCNRTGRLHGAMVCAIADIALGQNVGLALVADGVAVPSIATVSMSTDFAGTAKVGDWIEAHVDVQRVGKQMAFANAYLVCDGERIARISGIYRVFDQP